jgi:hypothetical protein
LTFTTTGRSADHRNLKETIMKTTIGLPSSNLASPFRVRAPLARLAASVALAACLGVPAVLLAQSDDFNDGDDAGWLRLDPIRMYLAAVQGVDLPQNIWTVTGGKYRLQSGPTPNPALGQGRVLSLRSEVYSNFHIAVDVLDWDASKTNALALAARIETPGPTTTKGYLFGYISGENYLDLVRLQNEGTRGIAGVVRVPIVLTPGHGYRFTFTGKGAQLVGRVYDLADLNNPIAEMAGSDGINTDGVSGMAVFPLGASVLGAGDATFDNFAATDRERPRITATIDAFSQRVVVWPQYEGDGFTLQGSAKLGADANWTDITASEIFPDPAAETFFFDATGSPFAFFRLKKAGGMN